MLEEHISSKYLETLSYNFSIKVIFIFAFIGNRMDLFYFHTKTRRKKKAKQKPSIEWLFSGVISFDKTKNKTHQCNGNFSSFRIYSFFLFFSSLSHFAMSLRFLLSGEGCREGWNVCHAFEIFCFPRLLLLQPKKWIEIGDLFVILSQSQKRRKCIYNISPQNGIIMWMIMVFIFRFKTLNGATTNESKRMKKGLMTSPICEAED